MVCSCSVGVCVGVGVGSCGRNGSEARMAGFNTTDTTDARQARTTTIAAIMAMMPSADVFFFAAGAAATGRRLPVPGGAAPIPPALTGTGNGIGMLNASCDRAGIGAAGIGAAG